MFIHGITMYTTHWHWLVHWLSSEILHMASRTPYCPLSFMHGRYHGQRGGVQLGSRSRGLIIDIPPLMIVEHRVLHWLLRDIGRYLPSSRFKRSWSGTPMFNSFVFGTVRKDDTEHGMFRSLPISGWRRRLRRRFVTQNSCVYVYVCQCVQIIIDILPDGGTN